jgi:hypothetical protein
VQGAAPLRLASLDTSPQRGEEVEPASGLLSEPLSPQDLGSSPLWGEVSSEARRRGETPITPTPESHYWRLRPVRDTSRVAKTIAYVPHPHP